MSRTKIDFSEHEFSIKKDELCTIYELKKPNTSIHKVIWICVEGATLVKGDFNRWSFCREFHPKINEKCSDGYFDEKIQISSTHKTTVFDQEVLKKRILEYIEETECEGEILNFFEDLKGSYDEYDYAENIRNNRPSDIDYESIPTGETRSNYLNAIYDAFDEMCIRMKNIDN